MDDLQTKTSSEYTEERWAIAVKIKTTKGEAKENIEIQYEKVNLSQYINKYPGEKGVYDTYKNILNVSVNSVCLLAAVLGIYSYFSG